MATVLYRIGRYAYRSPRVVGLIWLGILLLVTVGAATLGGPASSSLSIPGTESQEAFDLLEERFPAASADGATARVVFAAPEGSKATDPAYAEVIDGVLSQIAAGPQVARIGNPLETGLVSADGRIALAPVIYSVDVTLLEQEARDVLSAALETGRAAGLTVESGGTATEDVPEIGAELIGVAIAVLVLILTFGSLVAAGMPLVTGISGVVVALLAITAAMGVVDVSSVTPLLAVMLGLAVGIDYSLFILSRYRHELLAGSAGDEAAGRAIGTAGTAVVFAGLTVVIALVALAVNGISMLTEMGLAAAFTVLVAMAVALTLLPALLGLLGGRILGLRVPGLRTRDAEADDARSAFARRWVDLVMRRPVAALVIAVLLAGSLAIPVRDFRLGFADEGSWAEDTTQRKAYDLISEGFGPGFNGQLLVVVDAADATDPAGAVDHVAAALAENDRVQTVFPPQEDANGSTAVFTVVPAEGPSAVGTEQLVEDIRTSVAEVGASAGAEVVVTGSTALQIDVTDRSRDAVVPYLLILVGLSLLLLLVVFRSLLVPVKATLGFLLTVAASFGMLVGVFQWGWLEVLGIDPTGQTMALLPLVIVGIAFGLAMDYEFFLVTRMREAWVQTGDPQAAIATGFTHSARVVTAAASIMIAVFGAFGLLNDAVEIAQLGLALAVAIAVDAFVVRMTIVPAVLSLVGKHAWWLPRWLDRLLPDVDVEGTGLARYLAASAEESEDTPSTTVPAG
jgi:RND superfamily putative drug exporter